MLRLVDARYIQLNNINILLLLFLLSIDSLYISVLGFNMKLYHFYLIGLIYFSLLIGLYKKKVYFKVDSLFLFFILYLIFNSLFISSNVDASINRLVIIIFFFVTFTFISSVRIDKINLIKYISIMGVAILVIAILQLFLKYAVGLNIHLFMEGRPQAFFEEPDWLGYFYLFTIPYTLYYVEKRGKYFYFIAHSIGLLLSQTRGAWIAFGIGMILYYSLSNNDTKKRYSLILMISSFFIIFLIFISFLFKDTSIILAQLNDRLINIANPSHGTADYRLRILKDAFLIDFNYITGMGLDNFGTQFLKYSQINYGERSGFWNMYLNLYFDLGILGLTTFLLIIIKNIKNKYNLYKLTSESVYKYNILSLVMMLIANNISNGFYFLFFWLNLALLNNTIDHRGKKRG